MAIAKGFFVSDAFENDTSNSLGNVNLTTIAGAKGIADATVAVNGEETDAPTNSKIYFKTNLGGAVEPTGLARISKLDEHGDFMSSQQVTGQQLIDAPQNAVLVYDAKNTNGIVGFICEVVSPFQVS